MSDTDIVKFLMPDGTEVSNDPRFDQAKQLEKMLASRPNTGDVGVHHQDQVAQTQVEHPADLNSGQPGVGERAVPADPMAHFGPLGSPAQQVQKDDVKEAQESGGSPDDTSVEDPEPVDSNEAVLAAREARAKAQAKLAQAEEDLGEDGAGDPEKPYSEWTGKQLKHEVLRRNADRDEEDRISTKGAKKVSDLVERLEADDAAQAEANGDDGDDNN